MKLTLLFIVGLTAWLLTTPVEAQGLTYWGKTPDVPARGWIKLGEQYFEVQEGSVIPGWGTVKALSDDSLVIHRPLTEPEQEQLRQHGAAVYDAQEIRIRNLSRRLEPAR